MKDSRENNRNINERDPYGRIRMMHMEQEDDPAEIGDEINEPGE